MNIPTISRTYSIILFHVAFLGLGFDQCGNNSVSLSSARERSNKRPIRFLTVSGISYDQLTSNPVESGTYVSDYQIKKNLNIFLLRTSLASVFVIKLYRSGNLSRQARHTDRLNTWKKVGSISMEPQSRHFGFSVGSADIARDSTKRPCQCPIISRLPS